MASVGCSTWVASAFAAERPCASLPQPERVAADISTFGAGEVLRDRLWPDPRVFEGLLDKVETGDPLWLQIAVALRAVSDGGASEGLVAAVSVALTRQPENVLRLLSTGAADSSFTVADVCSARFAFTEQPAAEKRWRIGALQALAAAHDGHLTAARDACLAALPLAQ
jgi:hypothetical protein